MTRRLPHLALLVVVALGAAACSDDEPTGSTAVPTPTATETSAETTEPEPTEPTETEPTEPIEPTESAEPTETPEPTEPVEPTPTGDPDGLPTTYDEGVARFDAATPEYVQVERFTTPDDTYCVTRSESFVGCELGAGAGVADPDVLRRRPEPERRPGDDQLRGRDPRVQQRHRARARREAVEGRSGRHLQPQRRACLVEEIGVTCVDDLRAQGFFLGADRYLVF